MIAEAVHAVPNQAVDIPWNPHGHFQLHLYRVITRLIRNIDQTLPEESRAQLLAEYPFVAMYRRALETLPVDRLLAEFASRYEGHLPVCTLQTELALTDLELSYLLAAGLIEEDIRFGALFAALQHPLVTRQPCLGLLGWLLAGTANEASMATVATKPWRVAENLAAHGLIEIKQGEEAVRLEWTVRVPVPIWDALRGETIKQPAPQIFLQASTDFCALDELILPDELLAQILHLPAMIGQRGLDTLVLRGMSGTGRRTTIGAIARTLGRDILLYQAGKLPDENRPLLGPLATLTGAMPVIRLRGNPGETVTLDRLPGYTGVLGVTMGRMGGIDGSAMQNALTLTLPPPDAAQRARFWQASDAPMQRPDQDSVAHHFLLSGGRIRQVAALAQNQMRLAGCAQVRPHHVQLAMRSINRQALETLATPLSPVNGWSSLVVHPRVAAELHALEARCRGREALQDRVGFAFTNNLNRGVRALFGGSSGTGKTLAARALAGALNMDIYRVDLAGVVNKYIGETEKNLNQVFTQAEELDVILLLDEGDSLMSQRTEVKGSNDRYANLETNFLLQRLENYEGIILITTNASQRIDQAFVRRLDVTIDFALPETDQRQRLWALHLPEVHSLSQRFLARVAARCDLSGGQIRNATLHAALLAMQEGAPILDAHLDAALQREYRKAGIPYPLGAAKR